MKEVWTIKGAYQVVLTEDDDIRRQQNKYFNAEVSKLGSANKFIKIYSGLTMNWTASDTIVAPIKVLTFFLEETSLS